MFKHVASNSRLRFKDAGLPEPMPAAEARIAELPHNVMHVKRVRLTIFRDTLPRLDFYDGCEEPLLPVLAERGGKGDVFSIRPRL